MLSYFSSDLPNKAGEACTSIAKKFKNKDKEAKIKKYVVCSGFIL
jgi:hypothetical protein